MQVKCSSPKNPNVIFDHASQHLLSNYWCYFSFCKGEWMHPIFENFNVAAWDTCQNISYNVVGFLCTMDEVISCLICQGLRDIKIFSFAGFWKYDHATGELARLRGCRVKLKKPDYPWGRTVEILCKQDCSATLPSYFHLGKLNSWNTHALIVWVQCRSYAQYFIALHCDIAYNYPLQHKLHD